MKQAHRWLVRELTQLNFAPYRDVLPLVSSALNGLVDIEHTFLAAVDGVLTKRQAVAFGLLARIYQLSVSCLLNQLLQNHAGWHCSYRSLLETFFVIDWLAVDGQRFEAYFEGTAPGIGRIKNESCGRHPQLMQPYHASSEVTHVGFRSLHLSRKGEIEHEHELPFSVSEMSIGPEELDHMMSELLYSLTLCEANLRQMMINDASMLKAGELLWDRGKVKSKYGCLGYSRKDTPPGKPGMAGEIPAEI